MIMSPLFQRYIKLYKYLYDITLVRVSDEDQTLITRVEEKPLGVNYCANP